MRFTHLITSPAEFERQLRVAMTQLARDLERACAHCHGVADRFGDYVREPDPLYCPVHGASYWQELDELERR